MDFPVRCIHCNYVTLFSGSMPVCPECGTDRYFDHFVPFNPNLNLRRFWHAPRLIGHTPLVELVALSQQFNCCVLAKAEHTNPTGSFKDRETEAAIAVAMAQGRNQVSVISSGNAAVSAAELCRWAGLACRCFVPEKTSPGKLTMLQQAGAEIVALPGFFEDVYRAAIDQFPDDYHISAGQNPFRELGDYAIAHEIIGRFGVPDRILVPCGNGLLLHGIYAGFASVLSPDKFRLPRFYAVQIAGAAPLAVGLARGESVVALTDIEDSVAEGIVAMESYCAPKTLQAIRMTGGGVLEVTDDAIIDWARRLPESMMRELEPTALTVFPALSQLQLRNDETVLVMLTGSLRPGDDFYTNLPKSARVETV